MRSGKSLSLLRWCVLCLTAVLLVGCSGSVTGEITKGPLLLNVSQTRVALMWETDSPGDGKVLYGKDKKLAQCIDSEPERIEYKNKRQKGRSTVFVHKLWIEGLEAGQVYYYRVAGPESKSKIHSFRTQPTKTDEVTFIVYGDSRSVPGAHRKVVEQMLKLKKQVDFIVHTGDMVSRGGKYEQWGPQFFEPLKGLAEYVPIYCVRGNHECKGPAPHGNYNFEKLLMPPGQENNYSFGYGPVHYYCADNASDKTKAKQLLKKIAGDIKSSEAQWNFVSYHKPSINFGGHWSDWGGSDALRVLAKAGADFVVTGHSHQYERFRPIAIKDSVVTYITSGGGGAPMYDVEPTSYHAKAQKVRHFCLFHVKGDKLTMKAIDIRGRVIDRLAITKSEGRLNKKYLKTAVTTEEIELHQTLYKTGPVPLVCDLRKGLPFDVTYKLQVPPLPEAVKMTFKLSSEKGNYKLSGPKTLTIPKQGGFVDIKLSAVPLVDVKVPSIKRGKSRPFEPALRLECYYETGKIKEKMSWAVVAGFRRK